MTAVSSSSVCTVSNACGAEAIAWKIVSVPSMGEGAARSAGMMKKCSQPSVSVNPRWPCSPIGSSGVPSKQMYALASESLRW